MSIARVLTAALCLSGCALEHAAAPAIEVRGRAVAVPGSWSPPPEVTAVADTQNPAHQGSPLIADGGRCASPDAFDCSCVHPACSGPLPGTAAFADHLRRRFPQIRGAGGFECCRQNTGNPDYLSVHSIGRAIDLSIPEVGGDADNTAGDEVANWLIMNAARIGVQQVIWDRGSWRGSRPAGQKMRPYEGPIPHTDHIHMELNLDGANARTPFFTSGEVDGGGQQCAPGCEGAVIVDARCGRGDCAVFGQTCLADPEPRCGVPECPRQGAATICLDDSRIATCDSGVLTGVGECGLYGAFCSVAGRAPTDAHCVFSLCVGSPQEVPREHTGCSLRAGARLACHADATFEELECPAGQVCRDGDGDSECVPPAAECPPNFGEGLVLVTTCIDGQRVECVNGNLVVNRGCEPGSTCRMVDGAAVCLAQACLDAAGPRPGARLCLDNGAVGECSAAGTLEVVATCGADETCRDGACEPRVGPSPPDAARPPSPPDRDAAAAPVADAAGAAGEADAGPGGPSPDPARPDALRPGDDARVQTPVAVADGGGAAAARGPRGVSLSDGGGCAVAPARPGGGAASGLLAALGVGLAVRRRRPRVP
jgi:hypothetical protein